MRYFAGLLLLAAVASAATVTVPYKNCAAGTDLLTIASVSANVWPPVAGQEFDLTLAGSLSKAVSGGSYKFATSFDGIQVDTKTGPLTELNITLPVAAGPWKLIKSGPFPSDVPSGTIDVTLTAVDESSAEIFCIQLTMETVNDEQMENDNQPEFDGEEDELYDDSDFDQDYDESVESENNDDEEMPYDMEEMKAWFEAVAGNDVPVPFQNCGQGSDLLQIVSATASVWPPVKGQPITVNIAYNITAQINDGTYEAKVSFDGFPLVDKKGDLKDLTGLTLPVPAGAGSLNKTVTIPTGLPSGAIAVTISATADNGQEIGCISLQATI